MEGIETCKQEEAAGEENVTKMQSQHNTQRDMHTQMAPSVVLLLTVRSADRGIESRLWQRMIERKYVVAYPRKHFFLVTVFFLNSGHEITTDRHTLGVIVWHIKGKT